MQFHHSFTHLISFSSNGALTSNKITQHPKKSWKQPKTHVCCQSVIIRYFRDPRSLHILLIFFSQTLSSRSSPAFPTRYNMHFSPWHLGDVVDLIMVAFRITRHTWQRLPASMLTLASQHRWQCTPSKKRATIHMQVHRRTETKRTRMNIAVDQRHPWYASEVFGFLLPAIPISS